VALLLLALAAVAEPAGLRHGVPAEGRDWLLAALCAPLGARIAGYDRRNPIGWLLLAVGVLGALTVLTSLAAGGPAAWVRGWAWWPGYGLLVLAAALFPGGRPSSPRWRPVVAVLAGAVAAGTAALAWLVGRVPGVLTGASVGGGWDRVVFLAATAVLLVGGVLAAVSVAMRIRRAATRGPLLWAAASAGLLAAALLLDTVQGVPAAWLAGVLAIPVAATVGVVRYGLYDVGLLVHRGLLYGLLTVAVVVLYAGAVTATTWVAPGAATPVAVAVAAVALLPLRQRLQSRLDRLLYGTRPYDLVTGVGRRAGQVAADRLLDALAEQVGTGLRVPYVALEVDHARAVYGRRRSWPVTRIPLTHHGGTPGRLVVQHRGPDEPWTRRDRALLADLADQLGPIVASVRLREERGAAAHALAEESRRLQRDLHDGLGPALFGARMLVRVGRAGTGETAVAAWDELDAELAAAGAEIRRIVAGLGPAALDRGLAAALDAVARRHRTDRLAVRLDLGAGLTGLPAAVEVAAYRIADEGLTNVGRHARARTAVVTVRRDGGLLHVSVCDDGAGGATDRPGGIGLGSLRERCAELGGRLHLTSAATGTLLRADLPLAADPPSA
jgi:signal transduction histidine kinase